MADGLQWLVGLDEKGWTSSVVFARGISAAELAVRMGGDPDGATEPITDAQVWNLRMEVYRPGASGDGVVRVGESAGWAYAVEYGDSTGSDLLTEISRSGVEVIRYYPIADHPPATVDYARDGEYICGFGLAEEEHRWGQQPDLLLPELVAAHVLQPDGSSRVDGSCVPYEVAYKRTLSVFETRFGLSLPRACLGEGRLPAYAVRGTPDMHTGREPDYYMIMTWANANGLACTGNGTSVPAEIREAFRQASGSRDS
ncbi:hypothetical protein AB0C86_40920 [Streptomyces lavendulae]|uniref:DUF6461 domain-containing protein n=1 Tax=Streptomyces lavendulae TaxID=1914 RepID=UPI0033D05F56